MTQTKNPSPNGFSMDSISSGMSKYEWDALLAGSEYIRRTSWQLRALPKELNRLPDDIIIPEKLQQLLTWSLVPGRDWSFQPPPKAEARSRTHSHGRQPREVQKTAHETEDDTNQSVGSMASVSTSSYVTSASQLSSRTRGRSPDSDKSLKNKLLAKIRLGKADGRSPSSEPRDTTKVAKDMVVTAECTSCFEELPETEMTRLKSCRHWYCNECLNTLIVTAMAAEASFPPKCCLSPIPLKQILKALNANQRENFQNKAAEYAVPTADRWYCPNKDCLKWIPRGKLKINRDLGYDCPHCATKLCRTCRGPAHPTNTECPQDFGLEATLETAEIEGWQRCFKCRALVEHNRGCRHMTCRCKAEFCYVCGLKWLTCECTETDAANKRAGIQQRRQDRAAKVDAEAAAEAAEIARIIAEVEEMERREAEQRLLDEERRQREEDEQLRLLEAERQAEETRKQEEAEQAEREFRRALIQSFEEELVQMNEVLHRILRFQFEAISTKHSAEDIKLSNTPLEGKAKAKEDFDAASQILSRNSSKRVAQLSQKHKSDTEALELRQEEEEDDLFLQLQMRFKGKANRETRMERMMGEIRNKQGEERQELQAKHKSETEKLDQSVAVDFEGLSKWYQHRLDQAIRVQQIALQKFGFIVGADRQYFEIVAERRIRMLTQHGEKCLASLEAGHEPIGLTEFEASKIEPCLPGLDDGEQGPSGIRRGPNVIMTPHGPLRMSPSNCPQPKPTSSLSQDQSAPIPVLTLETSHLCDSRETSIQRRPSQPPIPGAFPVEPTPVYSEMTQQASKPVPVTQTQPSPSQFRARPPLPSMTQSPPPTPSLTVAPLVIRKPLSVPTILNNSPPHPHRPPPLSQAQTQAQSQPKLHHIDTPIPSSSPSVAMTMASLAAGMALAAIPHHSGSSSQQDMKTAISSITPISPSDATNQDRRTSNASSTVSKKSSKWGFMKPKDPREITEEEMKRKLRAAVGDAF